VRKLILLYLLTTHYLFAESALGLFAEGRKIPAHKMVVAGVKDEGVRPVEQLKSPMFTVVSASVPPKDQLNASEDWTHVIDESVADLLAALSWGGDMLDIQRRDKMQYFTSQGWQLFKKNIWPVYYQHLGHSDKRIQVASIEAARGLSQTRDSLTLGMPISMSVVADYGTKIVPVQTLVMLKKVNQKWLIDRLTFQPIIK
jgi:hypothetical protein